jgi:putative transposase
VPAQPLAPARQETGIDLGLESFATLADGTMIHTPRCDRTAEAYLRRCQRRAARRKQGSARRHKALKLLAKAHRKIPRQRRDFPHKAARALVRAYDTLYDEDLRTAHLLRNPGITAWRSPSQTPGGRGSSPIRVFKAADAGKQAVAVPPAYTSQTCSGCGREVAKRLIRPLALVPV